MLKYVKAKLFLCLWHR